MLPQSARSVADIRLNSWAERFQSWCQPFGSELISCMDAAGRDRLCTALVGSAQLMRTIQAPHEGSLQSASHTVPKDMSREVASGTSRMRMRERPSSRRMVFSRWGPKLISSSCDRMGCWSAYCWGARPLLVKDSRPAGGVKAVMTAAEHPLGGAG